MRILAFAFALPLLFVVGVSNADTFTGCLYILTIAALLLHRRRRREAPAGLAELRDYPRTAAVALRPHVPPSLPFGKKRVVALAYWSMATEAFDHMNAVATNRARAC